MPKLVILESPFAGDTEVTEKYARRCMLDSLKRGEAPLVSHLLYTQVLDDTNPDERRMGILAGHAWLEFAEASVVYTDYGFSSGMRQGMVEAEMHNVDIEIRQIGMNDDA